MKVSKDKEKLGKVERINNELLIFEKLVII